MPTAQGGAVVGAKPTDIDVSARGGVDAWNSAEGREVAIEALSWGQLVLDNSNKKGYFTGATYRGWRADLERIKKNIQFEYFEDNEWWLYDTGQILYWLQWYSFKVGVDPVDRQLAWKVYTGGYPQYREMWVQHFGVPIWETLDQRPVAINRAGDGPHFKMGTYPINPLLTEPKV